MTSLLVKIFIKNSDKINDPKVRQQYGMLGGLVGIFLNVLLFCGKLVASLLSGSVSILADAFNNLSDAGSSVVTLIGFKLAGRPADLSHPFGHGRIEYVSGLIVSFLIILMGFELGKSSLQRVISPQATDFSLIIIIILIASILVKLWIGFFNKNLGKRISSPVMTAVASDSITDCISTFVTLVGALLSRYANLHIDGYIGIIVALFILYTGFSSVKESLSPLLGQRPDTELVEEIKKCVLGHSEVVGIHDLIVHNYGPGRSLISLHAEVDSSHNILDIHDTIDLIEMELQKKFDCIATIHMDPIDTDNPLTLELREKVTDIVKNIDPQLSIHDFRVVFGPTHTNLIFDISVPHKFRLTTKEITEEVYCKVRELDGNYFAVAHAEHTFV
ncbi:MAG: cation transporter [Oscillospiraceae bacterium]|nr:cation transporter [Oscillospiraceae bacterium]